MKYLPSENITYKSKLTEEEIIIRIAEVIEPKKMFRFFKNRATKPYEGRVIDKTFEISRIINYRNVFLPVIIGVIQRDLDSTTIKVKMRLNYIVLFFLCIWFAVTGIGCLPLLIFLFTGSGFESSILAPWAMLIVGYIFSVGGFKYESKKAMKDLQLIFDTEVTKV